MQNPRDMGYIPGSGRSPGIANSTLFQYSCLETSMGREAWQVTVHGVAKTPSPESSALRPLGPPSQRALAVPRGWDPACTQDTYQEPGLCCLLNCLLSPTFKALWLRQNRSGWITGFGHQVEQSDAPVWVTGLVRWGWEGAQGFSPLHRAPLPGLPAGEEQTSGSSLFGVWSKGTNRQWTGLCLENWRLAHARSIENS